MAASYAAPGMVKSWEVAEFMHGKHMSNAWRGTLLRHCCKVTHGKVVITLARSVIRAGGESFPSGHAQGKGFET